MVKYLENRLKYLVQNRVTRLIGSDTKYRVMTCLHFFLDLGLNLVSTVKVKRSCVHITSITPWSRSFISWCLVIPPVSVTGNVSLQLTMKVVTNNYVICNRFLVLFSGVRPVVQERQWTPGFLFGICLGRKL